MSIMPKGEDLRKAVQWISEQRRDDPSTPLQKIIEAACIKFNLSPMDALYLQNWAKKNG